MKTSLNPRLVQLIANELTQTNDFTVTRFESGLQRFLSIAPYDSNEMWISRSPETSFYKLRILSLLHRWYEYESLSIFERSYVFNEQLIYSLIYNVFQLKEWSVLI